VLRPFGQIYGPLETHPAVSPPNPAVAEGPNFPAATIRQPDGLIAGFSEADGNAVKAIESRTNHDVKAIEYFLKERLADNTEVSAVGEFIHFACTSEGINNICHALMLRDARSQVMLPMLDRIIAQLRELAHVCADMSMLSHTHGQPASPPTTGKEMANLVHRPLAGRTTIRVR